jgi:hypothetical protein
MICGQFPGVDAPSPVAATRFCVRHFLIRADDFAQQTISIFGAIQDRHRIRRRPKKEDAITSMAIQEPEPGGGSDMPRHTSASLCSGSVIGSPLAARFQRQFTPPSGSLH